MNGSMEAITNYFSSFQSPA